MFFKVIARAFGHFQPAVFGSVAMMTAVGTPVVVGSAGVAVDYAIFSGKKTELQATADAAALAAARELSLAKSATASVEEVARSYVSAALGDTTDDISTSVGIDASTGSVTVTVQNTWAPVFAHILGAKITPIVVQAKASLVGENKICVIATSASDTGAISMTKKSSISAAGCGIYSNSTNKHGFYLGDSSTVKANVVCSAGGVYDSGGSASTNILTDCPAVDDPLAGRATPATGGCDYNDYKIASGADAILSGIYCGGINISGSAKVKFGPGTYVLKDGPFEVGGDASISGEDVAFYFTGKLSLIQFRQDATIDLSGAESGLMAGLLFFEDPASSPAREHVIRAHNAHTLTGTIYLPKGNLLVDPAASVGANSAYTAIVAHRLIVDNGPSLVLNTNYGGTDVPVPDGIRSAANVVLAQ